MSESNSTTPDEFALTQPLSREEERKAKRAVYVKAWQEANREKIAAHHKARYEAKKESIAAQHKAHYEANEEEYCARKKAYYDANKEKVKACNKAWVEANKDKHDAAKLDANAVRLHFPRFSTSNPALIIAKVREWFAESFATAATDFRAMPRITYRSFRNALVTSNEESFNQTPCFGLRHHHDQVNVLDEAGGPLFLISGPFDQQDHISRHRHTLSRANTTPARECGMGSGAN